MILGILKKNYYIANEQREDNKMSMDVTVGDLREYVTNNVNINAINKRDYDVQQVNMLGGRQIEIIFTKKADGTPQSFIFDLDD